MLRGIWGDDERYKQTYWSKFPHMYLAGDGCKRDEDGDYWFMGRIDDVMNVSGHRISTTEVESALVDHPEVAEAAVVGRLDEITGQAICAFVTLKSHANGSPELADELREPRRRKTRQVHHAEVPDVHARAAQDAHGQDHAPPAARHRRRPHAGRHDDARRFNVVAELQRRAKDEGSKED